MSDKKLFEIWCEGDPRHDFTACHLGYGKGSDILEACEDLADNNPYFSEYYNPYNVSYKGCRIFDSEALARESYG
jgi:hypothetical protein